jgi:putative transposase
MRGPRSPGHAQHFLSAHGPINNIFCQRNRVLARQYRHIRTQAFLLWNDVTGGFVDWLYSDSESC